MHGIIKQATVSIYTSSYNISNMSNLINISYYVIVKIAGMPGEFGKGKKG